ncbi:hypothetical protein RV09_GL001878 [Enterococcus moraviensis]|nr:hypothetical protein RV09_GL001878 [Enterococcus moraviensis]
MCEFFGATLGMDIETDVYSYIEKLAIALNVHSFISEY